ncbi:MAG: helix-turn-helix domain-containing protein [Candidatus Omnitrophica bacterium]|nr:helix-turn-helix domain-containing protein [Candidatus Omnitrophota bacterium]
MNEKLLTLKEVSDYLGISEGEIEELVNEGKFPAYKIGGMFLRFRREQVELARQRFLVPSSKADEQKLADWRSPGVDEAGDFFEKLKDFLYFNDFYIVSTLVIAALLVFIVTFVGKV